MTQPTVSIVVPCYNVEDFLEECANSAINQTYQDLEIILVDDGSTDGTPALADSIAESDERVVVIHQPNRGLGAARNAGVRAATGDFLFFLDSDDLIPLDAISRMVVSALDSGSDLVSGVAGRFNSTRTWTAAMYRSAFTRDRKGTHLFFEPELLYDHIACSKLYRREFWDRHGFEFPEGVLFEDIELVTRAHCLATSVDLLAEPTYLWRDREADEEQSITQDRARPGSTAARFEALTAVDVFLREHAPAQTWDAHGTKVFSLDVPIYCRLLAVESPEYAAEFVAAATPLAHSVSEEGVAQVPALNRLIWSALRRGDTDALHAVSRILMGRHEKSLRGVARGTMSIPRALGDADVRRAVGAALRNTAGTSVRSVTQRVRTAASRVGTAMVARYAARRADERDDSIDGVLANVSSLERIGKSAASKVGVIPSARPKPRTVTRHVDLTSLGLVGTLLARVTSRRETGFRLEIPVSAPPIERAFLVHEQERIAITLPSGPAGFSLDIDDLRRFGAPATLRPGTWRVVLVDDAARTWNVASDSDAVYRHDDPDAGAQYRMRATRSEVVITVASLLPVPDRPARAQQIITDTYRRRAASGTRTRAVFYECYYGRSVGCHPRALFDHLKSALPADVEHVFVTQPGYLHPPPGATSAQRWTRRYHEYLQMSPLVISNCELHPAFERLPFQTVVQTWHGTPLKRIGMDIDAPKFQNEQYQDNLDHQSSQWSMMLSPTSDTDEIFPRAFRYDGLILPSGSPRNDRLVQVDHRERAALRSALGLTDHDKAVLFAPTFRDDNRSAAGYRTSPQCDLPALLASLPDNTKVLFRAHSNIRTNEIPWTDPRVVNVSDFPDAQDLIIAADVLVTDYSSMMFDWSLTGKPVVLFAPDLDQYRGVRDFYYDYEHDLGLDAVRSPDALATALEGALATAGADLSRLVQGFAHRDDGKASQRVVEEILGRVDF